MSFLKRGKIKIQLEIINNTSVNGTINIFAASIRIEIESAKIKLKIH
jgi:hypothetical protein